MCVCVIICCRCLSYRHCFCCVKMKFPQHLNHKHLWLNKYNFASMENINRDCDSANVCLNTGSCIWSRRTNVSIRKIILLLELANVHETACTFSICIKLKKNERGETMPVDCNCTTAKYFWDTVCVMTSLYKNKETPHPFPFHFVNSSSLC